MRRISSKWTFFYKRAFPLAWFGFIAIFIFSVLFARRGALLWSLAPFLIMPIVMAVIGYALFRKLVFDLVDEAWDDGDALVVKNSGIEERVPLKNIINIGFSTFTNPERVTLTLREAGRPGREITFSPPRRFLQFGRNPIISELIERVDGARGQGH